MNIKRFTILAVILTLTLCLCVGILAACSGSGGEQQTPATNTGHNSGNSGDNTGDNTQPAHEHVYGEWQVVANPTCTEAGRRKKVCSCGDEVFETINALGHVEEIDAAVAPTCTSTGLTEGKHCSRCQAVLVAQQTVDKLPHNFENGVCTECGAEDPDYDPLAGLTPQQIIAQYGDTINTNLEGHYDGVLREAFGGKYATRKDNVAAYQWDLGEVNNNTIQHAKLTILSKRTYEIDNSVYNTATIYVYNVHFTSPIDMSDLTDSVKVSTATATYTQAYSFSYDSSIQGTRAELAVAILQNAGIDASAVDYIIKDTGSSTTSELGTVETFVVSVCDGSQIIDVSATIQTASTDAGLIAKLQAGNGSTTSSQKATFSGNKLPKVDLTQA